MANIDASHQQETAGERQRYLKAPFPYFGGKRAVAKHVWAALGQPKHYLEPFFGSGAVLLARLGYLPGTHIETINDADGYIANVWRSLQFSPDVVARWCDWPVNHADLAARKAALIKNEGRLLEGLAANPEWHDPVMAGYWIWAASCWIGCGLTRLGQIPHLAGSGMGVHSLGQIPRLADGGIGVHSMGKIPHLAGSVMGVQEPYNPNIYTWFRVLSERLRHVRVVCGDWSRICGGDYQDKMGLAGIFFDPPYSGGLGREEKIYHQEDLTVAAAVREWALERGRKPSYRIVLAGYFDEHENLMAHGWRMMNWKTVGGYANRGKGPRKQNRFREALFFSPHCLQERLF